jgi:LSU ribosomal protein L5P
MEYVARPKKAYKEKIVPAMMEEFGYKSVMQVPKLEKIVVSQGLGDATADKKIVDYAVEELTAITGTKSCWNFVLKKMKLPSN